MVLLARNASAHTVLRTASAADSDLDQLAAADDERRNATHRAFVEMLTSNGPLRDGLSISDAADTMSALANPDTYALLTRRRNWDASAHGTLARREPHTPLAPAPLRPVTARQSAVLGLAQFWTCRVGSSCRRCARLLWGLLSC